MRRIIAAGDTRAQDAVITALNLKEVGTLIFPTARIRELADQGPDADMRQVLAAEPVREHFQEVINHLAATATGSASLLHMALQGIGLPNATWRNCAI